MSNEITVVSSLNIRGNSSSPAAARNQSYQNAVTQVRANLSGPAGPTPGDVLVSVGGTDINLSELTIFGGWATLWNRDPTNWVDYGIRNIGTNTYESLGELLPGESVNLRLSRKLGEQYVGTGTGVGTTALHFRANTAACRVNVSAFDA